jgi:heme exporter protein D
MNEFFAMGGYGGFVWPAFGVTAAVMLGLLIASLRNLRANQRSLEQLQARNPGRRARRPQGKEEAAP